MNISNYTFERYDFTIVDRPDKTCSINFESTEGAAFKKERRKLYIIHDRAEVLYIGEANSSIKTRFQRACGSYNHYSRTSKARGGYKGYKWFNKENNKVRSLSVSIAIFNSEFDSDEQRSFIEAIEGELVYIVRNELKYWPKFQNEIHFKNIRGAKAIAKKIFNKMNPPKWN